VRLFVCLQCCPKVAQGKPIYPSVVVGDMMSERYSRASSDEKKIFTRSIRSREVHFHQ